MSNGFAFNHDKSLQIYFFRVKHQAKNNFLKDVKSTVDSCFDVIENNTMNMGLLARTW